MLEHIFGSKTRVKLLALFLEDKNKAYFVRELTRRLGAQINSIRLELAHLFKAGLIEEVPATKNNGLKSARRYYRINAGSVVVNELQSLFLKSRVMAERDFAERISKTGNIFYVVLSGFFVGSNDMPTDVLIIGKVNRTKLAEAMRLLEKNIGRELNYTVLTPAEFKYRQDIADRFLFQVLESKKVVVVDRLAELALN